MENPIELYRDIIKNTKEGIKNEKEIIELYWEKIRERRKTIALCEQAIKELGVKMREIKLTGKDYRKEN